MRVRDLLFGLKSCLVHLLIAVFTYTFIFDFISFCLLQMNANPLGNFNLEYQDNL